MTVMALDSLHRGGADEADRSSRPPRRLGGVRVTQAIDDLGEMAALPAGGACWVAAGRQPPHRLRRGWQLLALSSLSRCSIERAPTVAALVVGEVADHAG